MFKLCSLTFLLMTSQFAFAHITSIEEAWTGVSVPIIMSKNFIYEFDRLPISGRSFGEQKYWSGDYWATQSGSINKRWNHPSQQGFNLKSPTREEAAVMSIESLSQLSPSEKYDLFTGKYNYPLRNNVSTHANSSAQSWEGICHGWAPATMNHNEPTPKNMTNPDGIVIPFGSSDIKALLSYYYAYEYKVANTHQMGRRCSRGSIINRNCKQDLNAGAFHIVLANKVGLLGEGFIADLDRYKQVWNHPINVYESTIIGTSNSERDSAPGTVKVIRVNTIVSYTDEAPNSWEPVIGTPGQLVLTQEFNYDLDLNAKGQIIGGKWQSANRPDFIWTVDKALVMAGRLNRLGELLND